MIGGSGLSGLGSVSSRALAIGLVGFAALSAGSVAAETRPSPYQIITGGDDGVWLVNERSGAVQFCRLESAQGPKVIDVFAVGSETRPGLERAARPVCSDQLTEKVDDDPFGLRSFLPDFNGAVFFDAGPGPGRPLESSGTPLVLQPRIIKVFAE